MSRSPSRSSDTNPLPFGDFQSRVAKTMLAMITSSRERWEATLRQMRQDGEDVGDVSYEQMRDFVERDQYTMESSRESKIAVEFDIVGDILDVLQTRGGEFND